MADKVVRNQIKPLVQQLQERIEATERTLFDPSPLKTDAPQPIGLRARRIENGRQLFAQGVGLPQRRAVRQKRIEALLLRTIEIAWSLAEWPQRVFEIIVSGLGQFLLEASQLLLPQAIDAIAIVADDMKA
jgi:hypothetical protein